MSNTKDNYKITIIVGQAKVTITAKGKNSIYELKRAIAKKYEIPTSEIAFRVNKTLFTLPDNTLLANTGLPQEVTMTVELVKASSLESSRQRKFDQVPGPDGMIMVRRIIPADNCCLFNAVAYALEKKSKSSSKYLRQLIATYIASEPEKYNEAVLEKTNEKYQEWILNEKNWGGAIEIEILSKHYEVEICTVDVQHLHTEIFGSESNYKRRIYILYDGAHYDVLVKNISEDMDEEMDVTDFDPKDLFAYDGALMLAKEINYKTQIARGLHRKIECGSCSKKFMSQKSVQGHYEQTGHIEFNQISS